jgi:hypothetical protein
MRILGRETEQRQLRQYYEADEPDFLVVSGRRRVGKTFLVREFFDDRFCFYTTGLAKGTKTEQLAQFNRSLNRYGASEYPLAGDWFEAFDQLRSLIEAAPDGKKVVFLDELPWMDTPKSKFISGLESFWNGWANGRADMLLIVCGSAAAWVARKLFHDTGGLHNRVTRRMWLQPFTLKETEELLDSRGVVLSRQQIVQAHMVFGGIPHYLNQFERQLSFSQNVDRLCFASGAPLRDEFDQLYNSLFTNPERHIRIVTALGRRGGGLSREEIVRASGSSDGGGLTTTLDELESSGFIRRFPGYGKAERDTLYQLGDPFSYFALRFLLPGKINDEHFWTNDDTTGARNAWRGYAFEQVCLAHIAQVKRKLGIDGVTSVVSSWRSTAPQPNAQIDLVIDRRDGVTNLCEIKYSNKEFEITKEYEAKLRRKAWAFAETAPKTRALHTTLITSYGVKRNKHSGIVQSEVTMDDLFA